MSDSGQAQVDFFGNVTSKSMISTHSTLYVLLAVQRFTKGEYSLHQGDYQFSDESRGLHEIFMILSAIRTPIEA